MRKKITILIILIVALIIATIPMLVASDRVSEGGNYIIGDEFFINQDSALVLNQELLDSFSRTRTGDILYPDDYAGSFIDAEGHLNINLVESDSRELSDIINSMISNSVRINTHIVQHSYNDMHDLIRLFHEYWVNNPYCYVRNNMVHQYIDVFSNRVVVGLYEYNDESVAAFARLVVDSPIIVFEEALPFVHRRLILCETNTHVEDSNHSSVVPMSMGISPGQRVYDNWGGLSAGYGVRRGNLLGFVTTPHGAPLAGTELRFPQFGSVIGHYASPIVFSGMVDAGMVVQHNSFFVNMVEGRVIQRTPATPVAGLRVHAISTPMGIQRDILITSITVNAIGLSGLVGTTGRAFDGDSGGLVYVAVGSGSTANAIGLIVASDGQFNNMVFSRADAINSVLNVVID